MQNIRIVLVDTTHPGNIGATARAMKTMGLQSLDLVNPRGFPSAEATAMASGADDLLSSARVFESLEEAVSDCGFIIGSSARLRSVPMPQYDAREGAGVIHREAASGQPVAVLFGRERHGLTNEQLAICHALVHIPANPEYASLNLSQAVQLVSYELRMQSGLIADSTPGDDEELPASSEAMESFYRHLQQTLLNIRFMDPKQHDTLMLRLRRFYQRARPTPTELNILRGILSRFDQQA